MTSSAIEEPPVQIAVSGGGSCSDHERELATRVGHGLAGRGAVLLCGGHGGVMAAAVEGARSAGGLTIGVLPGGPSDPAADPHLQLRIHTGMGQARNQILVLSAAAVIAIGGELGTLSEVALALKQGISVVSLESWEPRRPGADPHPLLIRASGPEEAVEAALAAARRRGGV